MELPTSRTLGPYTLGDEIARGGKAVIYRAVHGAPRQPLAIKILHDRADDPLAAKGRFLREAWIVAQLGHPNVVRIYDVGERDGLHYMALELLDGGSVRKLLRAEGPPVLDRTLRLLRQLSDALDHIHSRGVVHRDVGTWNAVVGPDDHLTLIDFGKARLAGETRPRSLARAEAPGHGVLEAIDRGSMAPLVDRSGMGFSADLSGLAMVAYELLTGRPPPKGGLGRARKTKRADEPAPSPLALRELPEPVEHVLLGPITADPAVRYRTAGEFVGELAKATRAGVERRPLRTSRSTAPDSA